MTEVTSDDCLKAMNDIEIGFDRLDTLNETLKTFEADKGRSPFHIIKTSLGFDIKTHYTGSVETNPVQQYKQKYLLQNDIDKNWKIFSSGSCQAIYAESEELSERANKVREKAKQAGLAKIAAEPEFKLPEWNADWLTDNPVFTGTGAVLTVIGGAIYNSFRFAF